MIEVLFVSKPVAPPWNDSSKNLVRDVAGHLQHHTPVLMGRAGDASPIDRGRVDAIYRGDVQSGFSPGLRDRFTVLRHLLWGSSAGLWHFFFAPNRQSSAAGRFAKRIRRVPSVHTACSMPPDAAPIRSWVFADVTVALSRAAFDRFAASGVARSELRRIPPCVPDLGETTPKRKQALRREHGLPESASIWIYPGDLELGGGAEIAIDGLAAWDRADALLLMACRDKTPKARQARAVLEDRAERRGVDSRLVWIGETPHIHAMLELSDFVTVASPSAFGKMDYPLVALESMSMGRPVIVGRGTPAAELAESGAAIEVELSGEALAHAVETLTGDAARLRDVARKGRALVTTELSPSRIAAAYETLYEELHA